MPVYRDEDGNIIEVKSKVVDRLGQGENTTFQAREDLPPVPKAPVKAKASGSKADQATKKISDDAPEPPAPGKKTAAANKTQLVGRRRSKSSGEAAAPDETVPVVGWVVVKSGPGEGQFKALGYGNNTLGRGDEARVSLDWGDNGISRKNHCVISYDPRGRKFYIQPGQGANLTYLNEEPVLTPSMIEAQDEIILGDTVLVFVPFCHAGFDWQDLDTGQSE